ncbi:MAG: tetratricopeptide repeat protein [Gemmatimonadota bacterium]|nr:tetratricopeptide repeat protein [Gemmatimonadota bacterium]
MANDDIRALSEELAADPASLAFVPLGEALRRRGDLEVALRVAMRGVERHPMRPDAHDLVARVSADRGDLDRAIAEWETVLQLAPTHGGARKGLGFICFQLGRLDEAAAHLGAALANDPEDGSLAAALQTVKGALDRHAEAERATVAVRRVPAEAETAAPARPEGRTAERPAPEPHATRPTIGLPVDLQRPEADAGALFDDLLEGQRSAAMLLDADGLVLAGRYVAVDGRDLAADIGAQLSGVSDEAARAMRHLGLGGWRQIVFETEAASVAMAPALDGVLLVAAARPIPLGFVRRVLERAAHRAAAWMEGTR